MLKEEAGLKVKFPNGNALYGVSLGMLGCFTGDFGKLFLMNNDHSVNDRAAQTVLVSVKDTVIPVDGAHPEKIFLTDDDFLHLAAVINGTVLKSDSHL